MSEKLREYYFIATWAFVGMVAGYAFLLRIYVAWDLPLWLDESWTAVLSSAPTFQSFVHQMWLDSNAPLYYFLMWLWPFESTFALRIPSIAFMLAASLIAMFWRAPNVAREQAAFWAALLLLWYPATRVFLDARYYALLFALGVAQTIAFLRLDKEPTLKRATMWTGLASLSILTHYFAAILAIAQGIYFLVRHRWVALQTWPAMVLTVPVFAWFAYHWPRLKLYGASVHGWDGDINIPARLLYMFFVVGDLIIFLGIVVISVFFVARQRPSPGLIAAALPAMAAAACFALMATIYGVFQRQYLIPIVPPLMLTIAVGLRPTGYLPLAAWMFVNLGDPMAWRTLLTTRGIFGLEVPARDLKSAKSASWYIDYPGSKLHVSWQMENMLKDAFARAGRTNVSTHWGMNVEKADALIIVRLRHLPPTAKEPAGWPCKSRYWGAHLTTVCVRP